MPRTTTWKSVERAIAKLLHMERVPVTGRARGATPDIKGKRGGKFSYLSVEVKHRASLPSWLKDALHQATAAVRGKQLPVAIIHESGMKYEDSLLLIRLGDYIEFHSEE